MHRAITEGIRAAVIYAVACWPLFVLGVYLSPLRGVRRASVKLLTVLSWVLVGLSAGLPLLVAALIQARVFGYYHGEFLFPWEFAWIAFASPVVLSALAAGVSYVKHSKRKWVALVPTLAGVAAQGLLYAYFC